MSSCAADLYVVMKPIFGWSTETTTAEYNDSLKKLKEHVKSINNALEGKFLCGDDITVADFAIAGPLSLAFQTVFDGGFCKAPINQKAAAWFKAVAEHPAFIKYNGKVQICQRMMKPILKKEEKKVVPQAAAAKPKPKEEVVKDPIESLPACDFDLYTYKTFFCNHPDKSGEGIAETKRMFQTAGFNDGYSFWHFKYDKYGTEGQVLYKFVNLLGGFV